MRFASTSLGPTLAVLAAALVGCGGYDIDDDVDVELDFFELIGPSDDLHTPYVPGSTVNVYARAWGNAPNDPGTWSFESSDESVARIVTSSGSSATVEMVAPGEASIVLRGGAEREVRESVRIEVGTPVSAELMWHGELLLGHSEEDALVDDARTLVGEPAAFLVRWRDAQGRRLSGNGALRVEAAEEAGATTIATYLLERRDWLLVTPTIAGDHEVRISAGDIEVDAFLVTAVESDAVDHIVLEGQSEQGHERGSCLVVLAYAEDAEGRPIYGIDYAWDVDGSALTSYGDVLHYDYDPELPVMVGAAFEGERAEIEIHSSGGYSVSDSASVGCSAGGATAVGASLPLLLLSIAITLRRRK